MKRLLRVLLVEDNEPDAQLTLRELAKTGLEIESRRVETAAAFRAALAEGNTDLVIADYSLPSLSGLEALNILNGLELDLPFILISDSSGEELAVEAMQRGAHDYLLKHNLSRLAPAVERELREAEERCTHRHAEEALEENGRLLQEITGNIPGIIFRFYCRPDGVMGFDFVSGDVLEMLELTPEDLVADFSLGWNLVVAEDQAALDASIRRAVRDIQPWEREFRIRTPSGKLKWIRGHDQPVRPGEDGRYRSVGTLLDVTARKAAEDAVRQSEERYRSIFESFKDVYYEASLDGRVLVVSPSCHALLGLSPEELVRHAITDFCIDAGERDRFLTQLRRRHSVTDYELAMRTQAGKAFHAAITADLVRDKNGAPIRIRGVLRDVTERKRAEETRAGLEAQLRQAQKMEAIGTLAGGIAHDFNNMLTAIMGHSELLRLDCANQPNVRNSVDEILKAALRARDLVQQILTFSRRREQARVVTKLAPILKEVAKLLRSSLPSTIEIHSRIADVPSTLADPTQIHQVVMNLCTNAAQALGGQTGRLDLQLQVETVDSEVASRHRSLQSRRYVVLTVRDTGSGMEPAILDRIFDPFFTTKPPGEGTGLGLAVVHAIVEAHEGAITVESQRGQGSTFRVYLPVMEADVAPVHAAPPTITPGHNEEILLVDDEPPVLQIAQSLLVRLGYRVACFSRPVDAVTAVAANPSRFALVMTDLTMPNMTGLDVAQHVHKVRPDMPIILVSGMGGAMTNESARELGFQMLLAKPFEFSALAEAVARTLADARSPVPSPAGGKD